jgi:putative hydrolase of HD superfamily
MTPGDPSGFIAFARLVENLKQVRRQGWLDRGVTDPESSADHSWATALLAWLLAADRDDLDANRVLLTALVHDLPEALAGDETPFDLHRDPSGLIPDHHFRRAPIYDPAETDAKHARERRALDEMLSPLPIDQATLIRDAWEDYTTGATPEARFVKQVDKLETLIQAELYRDRQPEIIIESFRAGTLRDIDDPRLREVVFGLLGRASDEAELADDKDLD